MATWRSDRDRGRETVAERPWLRVRGRENAAETVAERDRGRETVAERPWQRDRGNLAE